MKPTVRKVNKRELIRITKLHVDDNGDTNIMFTNINELFPTCLKETYMRINRRSSHHAARMDVSRIR